MTRHISIAFTILLTVCGTDKNNSGGQAGSMDTTSGIETIAPEDNDQPEDTTNYDYATFFIVAADTSLDYFILHQKMFDLNRQLNIPIDTMGRFYNRTKNLIALPDNDEDEMYAGDYFPRRFPSEHLSLEYLSFYQPQAEEKTIALVSGIYETEKHADSALAALRKTEKKAFKLRADSIYIGCMH